MQVSTVPRGERTSPWGGRLVPDDEFGLGGRRARATVVTGLDADDLYEADRPARVGVGRHRGALVVAADAAPGAVDVVGTEEAIVVGVPLVADDLVARLVGIPGGPGVEGHTGKPVADGSGRIRTAGRGHRRDVVADDVDDDDGAVFAPGGVRHRQAGPHLGETRGAARDGAPVTVDDAVVAEIPRPIDDGETEVGRTVGEAAAAVEFDEHVTADPRGGRFGNGRRPLEDVEGRPCRGSHTETIRRDDAYGVPTHPAEVQRLQLGPGERAHRRVGGLEVDDAVVADVPTVGNDGITTGRVGLAARAAVEPDPLAEGEDVGTAGHRVGGRIALIDGDVESCRAGAAGRVRDAQANPLRARERETVELCVDGLAVCVVVGPVVVEIPLPRDDVQVRVGVPRRAAVEHDALPAADAGGVGRGEGLRRPRMQRDRTDVLVAPAGGVFDLHANGVFAEIDEAEFDEALRRHGQLRLGTVTVGVFVDFVPDAVVVEVPAVEADPVVLVRIGGLRREQLQRVPEQDVIAGLGQVVGIGVGRRGRRAHAHPEFTTDVGDLADGVRHAQAHEEPAHIAGGRDGVEDAPERHLCLLGGVAELPVVVEVPLVADDALAGNRGRTRSGVEIDLHQAGVDGDGRGIGELDDHGFGRRAQDADLRRGGVRGAEGVGDTQPDRIVREPGLRIRRPREVRRQRRPWDAGMVTAAVDTDVVHVPVAVDVPVPTHDGIAAGEVGVGRRAPVEDEVLPLQDGVDALRNHRHGAAIAHRHVDVELRLREAPAVVRDAQDRRIGTEALVGVGEARVAAIEARHAVDVPLIRDDAAVRVGVPASGPVERHLLRAARRIRRRRGLGDGVPLVKGDLRRGHRLVARRVPDPKGDVVGRPDPQTPGLDRGPGDDRIGRRRVVVLTVVVEIPADGDAVSAPRVGIARGAGERQRLTRFEDVRTAVRGHRGHVGRRFDLNLHRGLSGDVELVDQAQGGRVGAPLGESIREILVESARREVLRGVVDVPPQAVLVVDVPLVGQDARRGVGVKRLGVGQDELPVVAARTALDHRRRARRRDCHRAGVEDCRREHERPDGRRETIALGARDGGHRPAVTDASESVVVAGVSILRPHDVHVELARPVVAANRTLCGPVAGAIALLVAVDGVEIAAAGVRPPAIDRVAIAAEVISPGPERLRVVPAAGAMGPVVGGELNGALEAPSKIGRGVIAVGRERSDVGGPGVQGIHAEPAPADERTAGELHVLPAGDVPAVAVRRRTVPLLIGDEVVGDAVLVAVRDEDVVVASDQLAPSELDGLETDVTPLRRRAVRVAAVVIAVETVVVEAAPGAPAVDLHGAEQIRHLLDEIFVGLSSQAADLEARARQRRQEGGERAERHALVVDVVTPAVAVGAAAIGGARQAPAGLFDRICPRDESTEVAFVLRADVHERRAAVQHVVQHADRRLGIRVACPAVLVVDDPLRVEGLTESVDRPRRVGRESAVDGHRPDGERGARVLVTAGPEAGLELRTRACVPALPAVDVPERLVQGHVGHQLDLVRRPARRVARRLPVVDEQPERARRRRVVATVADPDVDVDARIAADLGDGEHAPDVVDRAVGRGDDAFGIVVVVVVAVGIPADRVALRAVRVAQDALEGRAGPRCCTCASSSRPR
jgi:hypothetical protein